LPHPTNELNGDYIHLTVYYTVFYKRYVYTKRKKTGQNFIRRVFNRRFVFWKKRAGTAAETWQLAEYTVHICPGKGEKK
jgi:hypothetical protein